MTYRFFINLGLFGLIGFILANSAFAQQKPNYQPTDNYTTTALSNGETYAGTWEDVRYYSSVKIAVKTDQTGVLTVQFSPDGSNTDSTKVDLRTSLREYKRD